MNGHFKRRQGRRHPPPIPSYLEADRKADRGPVRFDPSLMTAGEIVATRRAAGGSHRPAHGAGPSAHAA